MVRFICNSRYLRRFNKFKLLQLGKCILKTSTFLAWASFYWFIMRLTIFKDDTGAPKISDDNDFMRANETKLRIQYSPKEEDLWQNYTEEKHYSLLKIYDERNELVRNVCRRYHLDTDQVVRSREFFIHHDYGLIWCNVFKAASSYWMFNFNILGGYKEQYLRKTSSTQLDLARRLYKRPKPDELIEELRNPTFFSFMIVREPFVRILSAYRDKLEKYRYPYYKKLSRKIVKRYRDKESKYRNRKSPTFKEFVMYIIDAYKDNVSLDEHWWPYSEFCSPCVANFSVIAKMETFERDNMFIMRETSLEYLLGNRLKAIINKSKDGKDTEHLVKRYFQQLNDSNLDDLLNIYGLDFEMFGYDPDIYRQYVQKNYT